MGVLRALAFAAVVFLAACSGARVPADGGPDSAASIQIADASSALTAGDFLQLSATARNSAGASITTRAIVWKTSNANVAQVTPNGLVLALGPGTVTITATLDRRETTKALTVSSRSVAAGQLAVFVGPEETVYDYATQRCDAADLTDNQARPVRLADGSLIMVVGNEPRYHLMRGSDFWRLRRDCTTVLTSQDSRSPETYHNREWLWSIYREGDVIHGLVHNEYHDPIEPNCKPGDTGPANPCWYNSITYVQSRNNGASFAALPNTSPTVAPAPVRWDPTLAAARTNPHGYMTPSNIVKGADGYYYALVFYAQRAGPAGGGSCVIRTRNLGDPASWRAWNGSAFALAMTSPYAGPEAGECRVVIPNSEFGSLTYNTYLGMYVAVGNTVAPETESGPLTCGIFYALSQDLVRWSRRVLIVRQGRLVFNGKNDCPDASLANQQGAGAYGALIDHDSRSINFETAGQAPFLYNMKLVSASDSNARNLVRRPLIFVKGPGFTGDISPPQMNLDVPANGQTLSGGIPQVIGWAFDDTVRATRVEILVDGRLIGTATLGTARPDVASGFPGAPSDAGFTYSNFISLSPGSHTVTARAYDAVGNVSERSVTVTTA